MRAPISMAGKLKATLSSAVGMATTISTGFVPGPSQIYSYLGRAGTTAALVFTCKTWGAKTREPDDGIVRETFRSLVNGVNEDMDFRKGFTIGFGAGGCYMFADTAHMLWGALQYDIRGRLLTGIRVKLQFESHLGVDVTDDQCLAFALQEKQDEVHKQIIDAVMALSKLGQMRGQAELAVPTFLSKLITAEHSSSQLSDLHRQILSWNAELYDELNRALDKLEGVSAYDRGYFLGRATFEIASLFIAPGEQAAKLASKLTYLRDALPTLKFFQEEGIGKAALEALSSSGFLTKLETGKICFVAGTKVWTEHGWKNIEEIRVGDYVLSRDEKSGRQECKQVLETFVTHPASLVHVRYAARARHGGEAGGGEDDDAESDSDLAAAEELVCTPQHPFYVVNRPERGFVEAGELQVGDVLSLADGRSAAITAIGREEAPRTQRFTTYNFEVADFHTYFVGEAGVWVHNQGAWCQELFSYFKQIWTYLHPSDLWAAYNHTIRKLPDGLAERLPSRWTLRLLNDVREQHFAGKAGSTVPGWRNVAGQKLVPPLPGQVKRPDAEALANNLKHALGVDKPGTDFTAHHIVPTEVSDARPNMKYHSERARAVLAKHNIHIDEAANGTFLPNRKARGNGDYDPAVYGPIHNNIHTENYYKEVADRLEAADSLGASADQIRDSLQKIARDLVNGSLIP